MVNNVNRRTNVSPVAIRSANNIVSNKYDYHSLCNMKPEVHPPADVPAFMRSREAYYDMVHNRNRHSVPGSAYYPNVTPMKNHPGATYNELHGNHGFPRDGASTGP